MLSAYSSDKEETVKSYVKLHVFIEGYTTSRKLREHVDSLAVACMKILQH